MRQRFQQVHLALETIEAFVDVVKRIMVHRFDTAPHRSQSFKDCHAFAFSKTREFLLGAPILSSRTPVPWLRAESDFGAVRCCGLVAVRWLKGFGLGRLNAVSDL
jgi:hypothetical protein